MNSVLEVASECPYHEELGPFGLFAVAFFAALVLICKSSKNQVPVVDKVDNYFHLVAFSRF